MAGFYPDVPGHRIPYDRDGSIGFLGVVPEQLSPTQMQDMNDEDDSNAFTIGFGGSVGQFRIGVLFPRLMTLRGVAAFDENAVATSAGVLQTSPDTTNGADGTWTTRDSNVCNRDVDVASTYRSLIQTDGLPVSNVRGVRINLSSAGSYVFKALHLYGEPMAADTRLAFWHPTLNQEVGGAYFDWGDVAQGSVATRGFRLKNLSLTHTASSVNVSMEALTPGSPSIVTQHEFSEDGVNFSPSINVGALGPQAMTPVLTVKRTTPSPTLGLATGRFIALPGNWT